MTHNMRDILNLFEDAKLDDSETDGCVHIHYVDGKISNVYCHLTNVPSNCVVHMKIEKVMSIQEFVDSHDIDTEELTHLQTPPKVYDLGDNDLDKKLGNPTTDIK